MNCDIIQDLLPLYAEDMVSDASKSLVETHVASCDSCRAALSDLKEPKTAINHRVNPFQSFQKRFRFHTLSIAAITAFITVTIGLLIFGLLIDGSDALGYALLSYYFFLPITTLVCSILAGTNDRRIKWAMPPIFGAISALLPLPIFGSVSLDLGFAMAGISLVGVGIGILIRYLSKRKKEKLLNTVNDSAEETKKDA